MPDRFRLHAVVILLALLLSPALLQGCDGVVDAGDARSEAALPPDNTASKLRFSDMLPDARTTHQSAAKDGALLERVYLIVGMNDDQTGYGSYGVTKRRLHKYDSDVAFRLDLSSVLNAFSIAVSPDVLEAVLQDLQNDPDVAWVEPDIVLGGLLPTAPSPSLFGEQEPWGVRAIGGSGDPAHGVDIFVVDSGINSGGEIRLASSVDLSATYLSRIGQLLGPATSLLSAGRLTGSVLAADLIGHGTHIAGTIAAIDNRVGIRGIAAGTSIHNVRVLGPDGNTDLSTLLAAVEHIALYKRANPERPVVVNLSIGADVGTEAYNVLDRAIARSIEMGIVYIIAAGNDAIDAATITPAHVHEAITVAAHDKENRAAPFSNHGSVVDIYAPGEAIVSVSHLLARQRVSGSGTSYAAPHVTGLVARYLSNNRTATPTQVREALLANARRDVEGPLGTVSSRVYPIR